MNRVVIGVVTFFLSCFLLAKDFWVDRGYLDWSRKDSIKMLTKSPWASSQTVRLRDASLITGPSPAGSASACATCPEDAATVPEGLSDPQLTAPVSADQPLKFFVRFRTATPVRMALARLAILGGKLDNEKARDYLEQSEFPGKVVVVVEAEVQAGADVLNRANPDFLRENAFLLLKHSQRKVGLQQYVSPLQYGGGEAFFVFPREEEGRTLITLEEKEVRFICQINRDARIERKFKLDKMVFDGVLEL